MAWGKMDDGFDDHPKVVALLDEDDTATAIGAVGLWTVCWTWAHRNTRKKGQTPGLLPPGLPRRFVGGLSKDCTLLLVKHGLWDQQDDGGWIIHDFADYLPTDETRAARSAAGKRGAAARWANRDGKLPSASHAADSNADGTTNGKPMAEDAPSGTARATSPPEAPGVPSGAADDAGEAFSDPSGSLTGSKEPSGDGNLPSSRQDVAEDPLAKNGFAHGAISKEIAPEPKPAPVQPSAAAPLAPLGDMSGLSMTQRSKRITDRYHETEPMCNWPAINKVVLRGIKTEKWTDGEIDDAMQRLAKAGTTVSVESLRIELNGFGTRAWSNGRRNATPGAGSDYTNHPDHAYSTEIPE